MDKLKHLAKEERFILYVLSSLPLDMIYHDKKILAPGNSHLLTLLNRNKLLRRFAYEIIEKTEFHQYVDYELIKTCQKLLLQWEYENKIYRETLKTVAKALENQGIRCCLLKGMSLGQKGIPRDVNDIDLLIDDKRLEDVNKIMISMGYSFVGEGRKSFLRKTDKNGNLKSLKKWSNQFEYLKDPDGILIEIHTNFFERYRVYHFNMDLIWNSVSAVFNRTMYSKDLGCQVLSLEDRFWLIAMHNAFRRSTSQGQFCFRYLIDMVFLSNHSDFNWGKLISQTMATETEGFLSFSLELINDFFPFAISPSIVVEMHRGLPLDKKLFKCIQHHCFYSMDKQNKFFRAINEIFLPLVYRGSTWEVIKSLLILPRLVKPFRQMAQLYGLHPHNPFIPFLYLLEPFRIISNLLRRASFFIKRRKYD